MDITPSNQEINIIQRRENQIQNDEDQLDRAYKETSDKANENYGSIVVDSKRRRTYEPSRDGPLVDQTQDKDESMDCTANEKLDQKILQMAGSASQARLSL